MARFDDIAVGDKVIIHRTHSRTIATVERVSATQFVADGIRFTKYGRKVGERDAQWHQTFAWVASPEAIAEIQAAQQYDSALSNLRRLHNELETAWRDIDRSGDKFKRTGSIRLATAFLRQTLTALTGPEIPDA